MPRSLVVLLAVLVLALAEAAASALYTRDEFTSSATCAGIPDTIGFGTPSSCADLACVETVDDGRYQTRTCNVSEISYPSEAAYFVTARYTGAGCGTVSGTVAVMAEQCIVRGPAESFKYTCNGNIGSIVQCTASADCSGPSCTTITYPPTCQLIGASHTIYYCSTVDTPPPPASGLLLAGGEMPGSVAYYDAGSDSWKPHAPEGTFNGPVYTLTRGIYGDEVFAGGQFTQPGRYIAVWNKGLGWLEPFGDGFDGSVRTTTVFNGRIVAGGDFVSSGSVSVLRIAQWNRTNWNPIGTGFDGPVQSVTVYNGQLVAGGEFFSAGTTITVFVALWTGQTWTSIGEYPAFSNFVLSLFATGLDLYAGGWFTSPGNHVAQWNGSSWDGTSYGLNNWVFSFAEYGGRVVPGGLFSEIVLGPDANRVADWDGTTWRPMSSGLDGTVHALLNVDDRLLAGGGFETLGTGAPAKFVAAWNGTAWAPFGSGLLGQVRALLLSTLDGGPTAPPTTAPPTAAPTATPTPTTPGACELKGTTWRAQYYVDATTFKPIGLDNAQTVLVAADEKTVTGADYTTVPLRK